VVFLAPLFQGFQGMPIEEMAEVVGAGVGIMTTWFGGALEGIINKLNEPC